MCVLYLGIELLKKYRATGADLPFGDPTKAHHGVAMEGYFWHITDREAGRTLIALSGAIRGPRGPWTTIGLGSWPNGFLRTVALDGAATNQDQLGVRGGPSTSPAFVGDPHHLRVDLGPDAQLDLRFKDLDPWPHRAFGGSSLFQMVPGLNQYWHPWLLGGKTSGTAILGAQTWEFHDAQVYSEKNWGREGFPEAWWWGQAQGFAEPEACVAFAGDLEHLAGDLSVTVDYRGQRVWSGFTTLAALEHGGLDRAQQELRRRGLNENLESAPPNHWNLP